MKSENILAAVFSFHKELFLPSNLLLEVGFWGIPLEAIGRDVREVPAAVGEILERERLGAARIKIWLSSSRCSFLLEGLPGTQPDIVTEVRGLKAAQAFDSNHEPTPAALGFASSQGVGIKDLLLKDMEGERYIFVRKQVPGVSLNALLPKLATSIFGTMMWRTPYWSVAAIFPQPPAYLCALIDDKVPGLSIDGVSADRDTGLKDGLDFRKVSVGHATDFPGILAGWGVQPLPGDRLKLLETQLQSVTPTGGTVRKNLRILETVAFDRELPGAFTAVVPAEAVSFPKALVLEMLATPPEYLPFETSKGELLPVFLGFFSGSAPDKSELELRSTGLKQRMNQIRKRWSEDVSKPLDERVCEMKYFPDPDGIGTLHDFSLRIARRARHLNELLGWKVPDALLDKSVMFFFSERAMRLSRCFPNLGGALVPLIAESQGVSSDILEILSDLGSTWGGKNAYPNSHGAILIQLAFQVNQLLQASSPREAFQERILQFILARELKFDLRKCFSLPEDPPAFETASWAGMLFKKLQIDGVVRSKSEWILREDEFDPLAIVGALRAWPEGPPPGFEALASLMVKLRFRLQQVKVETLKISEEASADPNLENRLQILEALPPGDFPGLYANLLEAQSEFESALQSLPPVIDENSPGTARILRLLKRAEIQMSRFPFPSPQKSN